MDIAALIQPEIQHYIAEKSGTDVARLALQGNPFPGVDFKQVLAQVEARGKSRQKLPTWFNAENIIYPAKIPLEQTSSETTAQYKAGLVRGNSLIDLTGGFGVDDFYFSKKMKQVVHCEMNSELSQIAAHNFGRLKAGNIKCMSGDSHEILQKLDQRFDYIYIDPSRRNDAKGKVFLLRDCLPDVPGSIGLYFGYSDNILIKTAPLLDIAAGIDELGCVKNIHVIAVENEVRELIWEVKKGHKGSIGIKTVNFGRQQTQSFAFERDAVTAVKYGFPKKYLYEPNSAIMKSGGFSVVGAHFGLEKLHPNSHLYTSDALIGFPGRVFEIGQCLDYGNAAMKLHFSGSKANITTRNFPETVENLRKKWKIKDGGDRYAFFTTDKNEQKIVLLCAKINQE